MLHEQFPNEDLYITYLVHCILMNEFLILAFREEKITKPSLSENDLSAIKDKTFDILSEIIME